MKTQVSSLIHVTSVENFSCLSCGFALAADVVAASVIAGRAAVNQPNAAGECPAAS